LQKISIITVSFNSGETIEETIKSVISQDYPNIEYILIDGGSTDDTIVKADEYSRHIAVRISEPDKGIYDAMNKGVRLATGDIIGIINSDDVFASNTIVSEIADVFISNPAIDAVYGNITYFKTDAPGKTVRTWVTKPYYDKFFDDGEVPPHPSLFVKSIVYDAVGAYYPNFKISSDYEFMFRAFKVNHYKPYHLNKFVVKMRVGGESTRSIKNVLIGNREVRAAWKMNGMQPNMRFWLLRITKKMLQLFK
jgi:glycosyltransferase involved in cell wall biosynthesis